MEVVGLDVGRSAVKLYAGTGKKLTFASIVGEGRDRRLRTEYDNGYEVKYAGQRFFVGELARHESEFARQMMTDSKAHIDTLVLTLTALSRAGVEECLIVTGVPVSEHMSDAKERLKQLIGGMHTITVNGSSSTIYVSRVEVAVEGGGAFWSQPVDGLVRLIDAGSKTVNFITMRDRRYVDRDSGTLKDSSGRTYGFETTQGVDDAAMAARIAGDLSKRWRSGDKVFVSGGKGETLAQLLRPYFPQAVMLPNALYANAIGYYNIGRRLS